MADFSNIIQEINDNINTNGVGAIKGEKLNEVLRDMIAAVNAAKTDILPDGVLYGGIAWPNEPPTYGDDHRYFYLAFHQGNYPAFNTDLDGNSLVLFYWFDQGQYWSLYYLAVTQVGLQDALQGYLESKYLYMSLGFDAFSPHSSYVVGDYVVNVDNEGVLYKFTSNHPAGQWDEDDVAEATLLDYITDYVSKQLSGKQDTISDLATIRSGAAAGATAYQKPSGGIPKTDLASSVQTSLGKADTAVQQTDGVAYVGDVVNSASTVGFDPQSDTVWNKEQILSSAQKAQARTNIAAQEALVSGTNIKTINNESILGSGNINIQGGGGGGASQMSNLSDVNISSPSNGQALLYDSAISKWVNGNVSGGGSVTLYTADWIASTSSANGTILTDTLNLPQGIYLVRIQFPVFNNNTTLNAQIDGTNISQRANTYHNGSNYSIFVDFVEVLSGGGTIKVISASAAQHTMTYLERGSLQALKIS